jgi:uroporphyrinogen-III synthase
MLTDDNTLRSDNEQADLDVALLVKVARQLAAAGSLHDLLAEMIHFVTTVVESSSCMVYVLENDELILRASKDLPHGAVGRLKIEAARGVTGWTTEGGRWPIVITQGAYEDPRFTFFNESPQDRFEAVLSVPVISGKRLVGVVNVQNRLKHQYTDREIRLIATIGFLVGAEIEKTRLRNENSYLSNKLETRTAIEHAKSILQRTLKIGEDDAYRILQRESQQRRQSMKEIADAIILSDELKLGLPASQRNSSAS